MKLGLGIFEKIGETDGGRGVRKGRGAIMWVVGSENLSWVRRKVEDGVRNIWFS